MGRPSKAKQVSTSTIGFSQNWGWATGDQEFFPLGNHFSLMQQMRQMWLTDETAGAMNWCLSTTMAQIPWDFAPQVDGVDNDKDEEAATMAAWANTLLSDMDESFDDHVEDALAMIWAGVAPCEVVLKQRVGGDESRHNDGFYGISGIPLRDPRTIVEWTYDAERQKITGMRQLGYSLSTSAGGGNGVIPLWKICHYRTTSEMNNPWGRSLLLSARRAWLLKVKIQDSEAIGIERDLCGLPRFKVPQEVIDQSNEADADGRPTKEALAAQTFLSAAQKAVSDMRFNKSGGIIQASNTYTEDEYQHADTTPKYDFDIITTAGQRSIDCRTAVRDYDRSIAMVVMMQFLQLGGRSGGSYGLSEDQSSMGVRSFMALAQKIATEFTRKALTLVWEVNGFDKKYMPRLRHGQISKEAMQAFGAALAGIGKSAGLWETDLEMRAALAKMLGLPFDRLAQAEAVETARTASKAAAAAPTLNAPGKAAPSSGDDDEND